ncbi:baseplate J/gp47 family protein [Pararhodobacter sp. SW119]|uniref:baseplate J/gp47 family protein n=1 Tax=Pararhodobacter sp. SW119 TaxID=2780075 RepID=UPI001ADFD415|nr:baseplate J/gp47 family protein [Pararhodobacter sp. SW119]
MWSETVAPLRNEIAAADRARDLQAAGLNGLAAVLVTLDAPVPPGAAELEVHFHNPLHLSEILAELSGGTPPSQVFPIQGGHRLPAGAGSGQVQVTSVAPGHTPESLRLTVAPVGDYSTYRLNLMFDPVRIDPFFAGLGFKFRPGCFSHSCAPDWQAGRERVAAPRIDYLAKDHASFRHQMIVAMMDRVPGWQPSSEADFDQVLIDLFAAAADELSDFQDRVMAEARIGTARKRVSISRHARLMDYHLHQGQQATTWVWLQIAHGTAPFTLADDLIAWAGGPEAEGGMIPFATREAAMPASERTLLAPEFNSFLLHTWSGAQPALPRGTTTADIVPAPADGAPAGLITAVDLAEAIREERLTRLLVVERLNPRTGHEPGRDPTHRQLLHLRPEAQVIHDPMAGRDVVRIFWSAEDALRHAYSFTTLCPGGPITDVSIFRGNLVEVNHGLPVMAEFHEPGTVLPPETAGIYHRHFRRVSLYGQARGVLCDLPAGPLAWRATPKGGIVPPRSTLRVEVIEPAGPSNLWDERPSLVFSDDSSEEGDHFVVETDERQRSSIRFGNGINGRLLPRGATVHAAWQIGGGRAGNVGTDAIRGFAPLAAPHAEAVVALSNPFDVTGGADPEPAAEALRAAPEAYRTRQLRAVTPADYAARAEEVPGIARAVASYAWTGSWRTVRIVLDPAGTTVLSPELIDAVSAHLEAVRLIGEDLELRPPRFIPLAIEVEVCLTPDAWPEDMRDIIEAELSSGYTPDGRRGLFHPDEWTFGQALHQSRISGRLQALAGVAHLLKVRMRRWDAPTGGGAAPEQLDAAFDEIFLVENDPDHMERGTITLDLKGGRQ